MERRVRAISPEVWTRELEQKVREAIGDIRYGTVSLVIQDGQVIQIDKSEKIRLK